MVVCGRAEPSFGMSRMIGAGLSVGTLSVFGWALDLALGWVCPARRDVIFAMACIFLMLVESIKPYRQRHDSDLMHINSEIHFYGRLHRWATSYIWLKPIFRIFSLD
ncbi:MAG: hypothetical protein ACJAR9_002011 [Celeribacter sp.]|jgi:hypothetical protein